MEAWARGAQSYNSGESGSRKAMSKKKAARKRSRICQRSYNDATAKTSNHSMSQQLAGTMTSSQHAYEVHSRKDKRDVDLISDPLPFGRL